MIRPGDASLRQRDAAGRPLWQRFLLLAAAIGFFVGIYLSVRARPDLVSDLRIAPILVLALIAIPVTTLLNAEEFRLSGRLIGRDFSLSNALEVTIIASVANMLPIPGGTFVRIAALKSQGAGVGDGTAATLFVAFLWIAVAFVYAGSWLVSPMIEGAGALGVAFLVFGGGVLFLSVILVLRLSGCREVAVRLLLVKVGLVLLDSARIYLCFLALGVVGSFAQASALSVSSVVGAAVSIVPAGLGIREGAAALLSPWIALEAASGYLSTSLNRLVGLAVLAPLALYLGVRRRG